MSIIGGKIPIKIQPLFWLLAFFIGWVSTTGLPNIFLAVFVILISVFLHEMGHAVTATLFGQKARIELAAFGGFTYREGRKLKLWEEFLVVLNGPLMGLLIFLVCWVVMTALAVQNPYLLFALKFSVIVNLFWTLVNLVPVLPLDGGHLLSIVLEAIFGFKGVKMAVIAGLVISVAVSIFFFVIGAFLIGALFLLLTFESFRSLRYYKLFAQEDRDSDLQELVKSAEQDVLQGMQDRAYAKFDEVRKRAHHGILYNLATEEMAEILKNKEEYKAGYSLLLGIESTLSQENLPLFHYLAFMNRDYKKVARLSKDVYQIAPKAETALLNALAFGVLKEVEPAIGWLDCALREGLPSPKSAMAREEFNPIRQDRRFQELQARIQKGE